MDDIEVRSVVVVGVKPDRREGRTRAAIGFGFFGDVLKLPVPLVAQESDCSSASSGCQREIFLLLFCLCLFFMRSFGKLEDPICGPTVSKEWCLN